MQRNADQVSDQKRNVVRKFKLISLKAFNENFTKETDKNMLQNIGREKKTRLGRVDTCFRQTNLEILPEVYPSSTNEITLTEA